MIKITHIILTLYDYIGLQSLHDYFDFKNRQSYTFIPKTRLFGIAEYWSVIRCGLAFHLNLIKERPLKQWNICKNAKLFGKCWKYAKTKKQLFSTLKVTDGWCKKTRTVKYRIYTVTWLILDELKYRNIGKLNFQMKYCS